MQNIGFQPASRAFTTPAFPAPSSQTYIPPSSLAATSTAFRPPSYTSTSTSPFTPPSTSYAASAFQVPKSFAAIASSAPPVTSTNPFRPPSSTYQFTSGGSYSTSAGTSSAYTPSWTTATASMPSQQQIGTSSIAFTRGIKDSETQGPETFCTIMNHEMCLKIDKSLEELRLEDYIARKNRLINFPKRQPFSSGVSYNSGYGTSQNAQRPFSSYVPPASMASSINAGYRPFSAPGTGTVSPFPNQATSSPFQYPTATSSPFSAYSAATTGFTSTVPGAPAFAVSSPFSQYASSTGFHPPTTSMAPSFSSFAPPTSTAYAPGYYATPQGVPQTTAFPQMAQASTGTTAFPGVGAGTQPTWSPYQNVAVQPASVPGYLAAPYYYQTAQSIPNPFGNALPQPRAPQYVAQYVGSQYPGYTALPTSQYAVPNVPPLAILPSPPPPLVQPLVDPLSQASQNSQNAYIDSMYGYRRANNLIPPDYDDPLGLNTFFKRHINKTSVSPSNNINRKTSLLSQSTIVRERRTETVRYNPFEFEKNYFQELSNCDSVIQSSNSIKWPVIGTFASRSNAEAKGKFNSRFSKEPNQMNESELVSVAPKKEKIIFRNRSSHSSMRLNDQQDNRIQLNFNNFKNTKSSYIFSKGYQAFSIVVTATINDQLRSAPIQLKQHQTVQEVKDDALKSFKIHTMELLRDDDIQLIFNGKVLEDNREICSYGLKSNDEVTMVFSDHSKLKSEEETERHFVKNKTEEIPYNDKNENPDADESKKSSIKMSTSIPSAVIKKDPSSGSKMLRVLPDPSLIPKLTKRDYKITPDMISLSRMTTEELRNVPGLTIQNAHGKIKWEGQTDILGLDLDYLVEINYGQVTVYPDDNNKPPEGTQLNKPTKISLYNIVPKGDDRKPIQECDIIMFLKERCGQQNLEFLNFNFETRTWKFRTHHFTKVGLDEAGGEAKSADEGKEPTEHPQVYSAKAGEEENEEMESKEIDQEEMREPTEDLAARRSKQIHISKLTLESVTPEKQLEESEEQKEDIYNPREKGQSGMFAYGDIPEPSAKRTKPIEDALPTQSKIIENNIESMKEEQLPEAESEEKADISENEEYEKDSTIIEQFPYKWREFDTKYLESTVSWKDKQEIDTKLSLKDQPKYTPLTLGQSFRVCWGRSGQLLTLSNKLNPKTGTYMISSHQLMIHSYTFEPMNDNNEIRQSIEIHKMLTKILYEEEFNSLYEWSTRLPISGPTSIPKYSAPKKEKVSELVTTIVNMLSLAQSKIIPSLQINNTERMLKAIYTNEMNIWSLFHILFGNPCLDIVNFAYNNTKALEPASNSYLDQSRTSNMKYSSTTPNLSSMEVAILRKHNLLKWLQKIIENEEAEEREGQEDDAITEETQLANIANYLHCGLFESAVEECFKKNIKVSSSFGVKKTGIVRKYGLGVLLSEFPNTYKADKMGLQIRTLKLQHPHEELMHPILMKIYEMLSGVIPFSINHDWKRAFLYTAINNYNNNSLMTIQSLFREVADKILALKQQAVYPKFNPKLTYKYQAKNKKEFSECLDLCFMMIGMHSGINPAFYQLEKLLNAKGYTTEFMEKRLLFLLYLCFISIMKYTGEIAYKENVWLSQWLLSGVISELQMLGLWHWAIFILQLSCEEFHLTDAFLKKGIQDIIGRNIEEIIRDDEEAELGKIKGGDTKTVLARRFLSGGNFVDESKCSNVGERIINLEKGIYFMYMNQIPLALNYLEKASEFNLMHKLFYEHVAPTLLIKDDHKLSKENLTYYSEIIALLHQHSKEISMWCEKGGVLKAYLEHMESLKKYLNYDQEINESIIVVFPTIFNDLENIKAFAQKLANRNEVSLKLQRVNMIMREKLNKRLWKIQQLLQKNNLSPASLPPIPINNLINSCNDGVRAEAMWSGMGYLCDAAIKKSYSYGEKKEKWKNA